jgi:hypothetical protein
VHISGYDDLIYGEDGHSPIRKSVEDALARAKIDKVRLRVEVRTKVSGAPSQRQEHVFVADPDTSNAESIMRVLVEKLDGSPGPEFNGQIRINFSQSSHTGERYGSWTRTIRYLSEGSTMGGGYSSRRSDLGGEGEDEEEDNNASAFDGPVGMPMTMHPGRGAGPVDDTQMRQWLETTMGFAFRSMAQQMQMFERATRMMEAYTLRFGFPHPTEAGITEVRGEADRGSGNQGSAGASGMGILPMLLNAAANLANADSPAQVVERAASMATGQPPPQGAARLAAIRGAGQVVNAIQRERRPVEGIEDAPDLNDGPDGSYNEGLEYEDGTNMGEEYEKEGGGFDGGGMPDLSGLQPHEVKAAVIAWIRENPANKQAVMQMLPELSKEIM